MLMTTAKTKTTNRLLIDINECDTGTPCGADSDCVNTEGSFECRCHVGYQMDSTQRCIDVNECIHNDACAENARCINVPGSYKCICPQGFIGQGMTLCESQSSPSTKPFNYINNY